MFNRSPAAPAVGIEKALGLEQVLVKDIAGFEISDIFAGLFYLTGSENLTVLRLKPGFLDTLSEITSLMPSTFF